MAREIIMIAGAVIIHKWWKILDEL